VIWLHPDRAVDSGVFLTYLQNLQIQVLDLSFGDPKTGTPTDQVVTFFPATVNPPFPPQALPVRMLNAYADRFHAAAEDDIVLTEQFFRVGLLEPPTCLGVCHARSDHAAAETVQADGTWRLHRPAHRADDQRVRLDVR
jgi:hypothetical protein